MNPCGYSRHRFTISFKMLHHTEISIHKYIYYLAYQNCCRTAETLNGNTFAPQILYYFTLKVVYVLQISLMKMCHTSRVVLIKRFGSQPILLITELLNKYYLLKNYFYTFTLKNVLLVLFLCPVKNIIL